MTKLERQELHFLNYIRAAARYKKYDCHRQQQREQKRIKSLDQGMDENNTPRSEFIASPLPTPEEVLLSEEFSCEIQTKLQQLKKESPKLYDILLLRAEQKRWEEVAVILNKPQGTVAATFSRQRSQLKKRFSENR